MSSAREAYRARLIDGPCGQLARGGITWGDRVEGAGSPAITLLKVSPGRGYDHDGFDGLEAPRVQADIWAETFAEIDAIGDAYIAEIEAESLRDGFKFGPGFVDSDIDIPPITVAGRARGTYRRTIDMLLTWERV